MVQITKQPEIGLVEAAKADQARNWSETKHTHIILVEAVFLDKGPYCEISDAQELVA